MVQTRSAAHMTTQGVKPKPNNASDMDSKLLSPYFR